MEEKNMTALVSAFARAYHRQNNEVTIFDDTVAGQLLTDDEYRQVSKSMADGIAFFNPSFEGTPEQALRWIADNQLSPPPLGRVAFAERSLEQAALIGARQYLIFGAGYDTFAYRQPAWAHVLEIFEIDRQAVAEDKQQRLKRADLAIPPNVHFAQADFTQEAWQQALQKQKTFSRGAISFSTLLGVVYYLTKETFASFLAVLSDLVPKGSSLVFDYPDENSYAEKAGERAKKQVMLASAAKEEMLAGYSYCEMEQLLAAHDFLIYEHLQPQEMTQQYFTPYNRANPAHPIAALDNVNYCLAVKK